MSLIKINKIEYSFKCKISEFNLVDYMTIVNILNEDEYETYIYKGIEKKRLEPVDKNNRSQEFIKGLYKKILSYLSDIPRDLLNENELYEYLMNMLKEPMEIMGNLKALTDMSEYNHEGYVLNHMSEWAFYKWVLIEGLTKYEEGELNELKLISTMLDKGDFDKSQKNFKESYELFIIQMNIQESLPIYLYLKNLVNMVRSSHTFIYSSGGGTEGNSNLKSHNKIFGWYDTIRMLAEKRIFGNYMEVKEAPLFEVLEYLNISISHDIAEQKDTLKSYK